MRKFPKFDKAQRYAIVELILDSALDRIESGLPTAGLVWDDRLAMMSDVDADTLKMSGFERGALEGAGMALACFYAQQTGDGLAICDALVVAGKFDDACEKLVSFAWRDHGRMIVRREAKRRAKHAGKKTSYGISEVYGKAWPDVAKCAEAFCKVIDEGLDGSA